MKFRVATLMALALAASPLQAKWYEASSDHFVIYADDSEKDIRTFAENLEKYHAAMEFVMRREVDKPSPSNRVTIFVVGDEKDIQRLAGDNSDNIAGFYVPRAGASRAFVQDIRNRSNGYPHFSTVILLHEYAHHFLISSSRFATPRWLGEGAAEFFAAATFNRDGSVNIGRPAMHRAAELAYSKEVSVEELLDEKLYEKNRGKRHDAFYGMSWALYHYLIFNKERSSQLAQYWKNVTSGASSIEAARQAFGDLDQLDKEIDRYLTQRRMMNFELKPEMIPYGTVSLRELPEGEAEMMQVRIVSQRGVSREEALALVVDAREIAARYPSDPGVLTALAEAEFDAGNDDAAIAAADRAIALDPNRPNAYVQKGYALFRKAEDADDRDAAYAAAMEPFTALNRIENDHPMPLTHFYRSFIERGAPPTETAKRALERASELSPFDHGLAMNTALMQAAEGKIELAQFGLRPLAMNPHGGSLAAHAAAYLQQMEGAEEGEPWYPSMVVTMPEIEVEASSEE